MDHPRFITTTTTHQNPIHNSYPSSTTSYSYLIPQHPTIQQNPNPITQLYRSTINPPGVASYTYPNHTHPVEGYSYYSASDSVPIAPPPHFQDLNNARNSVTIIEAVRQYGVDPATAYGIGYGVTIPSNGTEHVVAHIPNSILWTNSAAQPRQKGIWKRAPKKTTIAQSLHCGICKVDCSSRVVYEHHILGKKHKKVMEKLNESINHAPKTSVAVSNNNPIIGPPEKPAGMRQKSSRSNATASLQEFETKKRKVLEGGAAAHAVRTCTICNVVCNSDVVFAHHLSGHKHGEMVKKYNGTATASTGNTLTSLASRFIL